MSEADEYLDRVHRPQAARRLCWPGLHDLVHDPDSRITSCTKCDYWQPEVKE